MKVLLFGGTSEGRALALWLAERKIEHLVCVATEYGGELLPECVNARVGRLSEDEMVYIMQDYDCVIDATHPYAKVVTETIIKASVRAEITRLRLLRSGETTGQWIEAEDTTVAAEMLETMSGNILLTTGSKELHFYKNLASRAYPRVLPVMESLQKCIDCGFSPKQIICMQGPFTKEMNEATMRQFDIKIMVTKITGDVGGFAEKIDAAKNCGCEVLVISRPLDETGFSLEEICAKLLKGDL